MDKQLLEALDNLSVALELLSNSLNNNDGTSGVATALQFGNFSDQLIEINKSIKEIKVSNKKILDNTETLIKLQKQKNDSGIFSGISQDGNKKMLKDGITTITLIAGAVLAIGLAFKLLGGVDWKSVLSLSIALPLIAYSFEKISQIKGLTISSILMISASLISISFAILISSKILSGVAPVGLFQLTTVVLIAAAFGAASFGLGKLISSFKDVTIASALTASALIPIVLVAMSYAIAKSSYILSTVKPIGLFQALTVVMISAAFGAASFGLGKLLSSFKDVTIASALTAAALIPIVLVAMSYAIAKSSYILSTVQPIGLFQALTAIMIAGTFVVLSYAVKPLMKGVEGVSLKQAVLGTLILLALSASVVAVAWMMLKMPIVPFSTILKFAITGVAISSVVILLALAIKTVNSLGTIKDYLSGGACIVIISTSISLSSIILSRGNYTNPPSIIWTLLSTASIFAYSLLGWVIGKIGGVTDYIKGGLSIIIVASTIMVTSHILSLGNYKKYPNLGWSIGVGLSLVSFGLAATVLGGIVMTGVGGAAMLSGAVAILGVAGVIVAVSDILAKGNFSKYPPVSWAMGVGMSLYYFAISVVMLGIINSGGGVIKTLSLGLVKNPIDAGISAVTKIATIIPKIDKIVSAGSYNKYPSLNWSLGVGSTLIAFTSGIIMVAAISKSKKLIDSGINAIKSISQSIVDVSFILKGGEYIGGPSEDWARGISLALGAFAPVYKMMMVNKLMSIFGGGVSVAQFIKGIKVISLGIIESAKIFAKNVAVFDPTKVPSKDWSEGVGGAISAFGTVIEFISKQKGLFGSGIISLSIAIMSISEAIVISSKIFAKGNYSIFPKKDWIDGTIYAIQKFKDIQKMLNFGEGGLLGFRIFGQSPLQRTISNVSLLAIAFSKLGRSMNSFSKSVETLDLEKLQMVKGLTNNVILLSLMDPDMLNDVLDKIEKRGGVFTELIKDFEDKKSSLSSTSVKTLSISPKSKSDYEMLSDKVDKMIILLSDIQSVVGSGGALKNYLISIKDPQLAGNNNSPTSVRR